MRKLLKPEPEWGPAHEREEKKRVNAIYKGVNQKDMQEMNKQIDQENVDHEKVALNV